VEKGRAGKRAGYAWADQPQSDVEYTPDPRFSYNSSGGPIRAQRLAGGLYQVVLAGLAKPAGATETVLVTEYRGMTERYCRVNSWDNTGAGDLLVSVRCHDSTGLPINAIFDLLVVE
jgi:hypothetical protein